MTASLPVFWNDTFVGVVSIDVSFRNLFMDSYLFGKNLSMSYAFVTNDAGMMSRITLRNLDDKMKKRWCF